VNEEQLNNVHLQPLETPTQGSKDKHLVTTTKTHFNHSRSLGVLNIVAIFDAIVVIYVMTLRTYNQHISFICLTKIGNRLVEFFQVNLLISIKNL
jgi:hypothetical protein